MTLSGGLILIGLLLGLPGGVARAHEEYSRREGLGCRVCHVSDQGGPLTAPGREFLWTGAGRHWFVDPEREKAADDGPDLGDWSGEAVTWARRGREMVLGRERSLVSVSQSLRVQGQRFLGREDMTFRAEGFGRAVIQKDREGFDDDTLDLVSAEVVWRPDDGTTQIRLGRQWVTAGIGAHRFDGAGLHTRLSEHVEVDAFGGLPTDNGLGGASGDLLVGGRVGYLGGAGLRAGVSSYYQLDDDDPAHGKVGVDALYSPTHQLDLAGNLFYDWIGEEFYDARAHLVYRPSAFWTLTADYTYTVPGLFIPKTSIFSVFSLDDYEEIAVTATHRLTEFLSARTTHRATFYDDGSTLYRLGVGADLRYGPGGEDRVGGDVGYHDEERRGSGATRADGDALFVRAYHLLYWTGQIYTTTDVVLNLYSGSPFGGDSTVARVLVGYEPDAPFDLQAGVEYLRNTDFDDRVDILARWTYRF